VSHMSRKIDLFAVIRGDLVLSVSTGSAEDAYEKGVKCTPFTNDQLKALGWNGYRCALEIIEEVKDEQKD
jgi:hypothetical protein